MLLDGIFATSVVHNKLYPVRKFDLELYYFGDD